MAVIYFHCKLIQNERYPKKPLVDKLLINPKNFQCFLKATKVTIIYLGL